MKLFVFYYFFPGAWRPSRPQSTTDEKALGPYLQERRPSHYFLSYRQRLLLYFFSSPSPSYFLYPAKKKLFVLLRCLGVRNPRKMMIIKSFQNPTILLFVGRTDVNDVSGVVFLHLFLTPFLWEISHKFLEFSLVVLVCQQRGLLLLRKGELKLIVLQKDFLEFEMLKKYYKL